MGTGPFSARNGPQRQARSKTNSEHGAGDADLAQRGWDRIGQCRDLSAGNVHATGGGPMDVVYLTLPRLAPTECDEHANSHRAEERGAVDITITFLFVG